MATNAKVEWRKAVAAVWGHNCELIEAVGKVRNWMIYGRGKVPPTNDLLSNRLNCEQNTGSGRIEAVASTAKALGRGNFFENTVDYWLKLKSAQLLNELRDMAELLPKSLKAEVQALIAAVEMARNVEDRFANFLADRSGCGEEITPAQWCERLDKLVRDLKKAFEAIRMALIVIERDRIEMTEAREATKAKFKRRRDREVDSVKQKDMAKIRTEVRRRARVKKAKGISTGVRKELERMYEDEAWSRRCRQWEFRTLYQYVCRAR